MVEETPALLWQIMIETLDDIIEELADQVGVYGAGPEDGEHSEKCDCRICFTVGLRGRIERAVEVEAKLAQ